MSDYNSSMDQYRTDFGKYMKRLRTDRKMTQAYIKKATGVAATLVSAFEHGERAVGPEVAEKLATGLQLEEWERDRFLIGAAKTRRKDRLINEARHLPPEILNYVPKMLPTVGIDPTKIIGADIWKSGDNKDKYLGNRLDRQYATLRAAMTGMGSYDLLHVVADGERYVCALLVVPAR
jgi:transcriptional regulator with XRE-family HTH domain